MATFRSASARIAPRSILFCSTRFTASLRFLQGLIVARSQRSVEAAHFPALPRGPRNRPLRDLHDPGEHLLQIIALCPEPLRLLAEPGEVSAQIVNPGNLGSELPDFVRHGDELTLQLVQALNPLLPEGEEPAALVDPAGHVLADVFRCSARNPLNRTGASRPQRGQGRVGSGRPSSSAQIGRGIQAQGHRFRAPVRRSGTDLGLRFFGDSGLDGFGFARLNRIRGPANAGGLHGRAEEACRHSAQYTPRLAAQESRSWSQAGASVQ